MGEERQLLDNLIAEAPPKCWEAVGTFTITVDPEEIPRGHSGGLVYPIHPDEDEYSSISACLGSSYDECGRRKQPLRVNRYSLDKHHIDIIGGQSLIDYLEGIPNKDKANHAMGYALQYAAKVGQLGELLSVFMERVHQQGYQNGREAVQQELRALIGVSYHSDPGQTTYD